MVMITRRGAGTQDPVKQIRVRTVEQGFELIDLTFVQLPKAGVGKRSQQKVAFLCSTVPAPEEDTPADCSARWIIASLVHLSDPTSCARDQRSRFPGR